MNSLYRNHDVSVGVAYKKVAVIGFGITGQSVIRYLGDSTSELIAMDTRKLAVNTRQLRRSFPKVRLVTGGLDHLQRNQCEPLGAICSDDVQFVAHK